MGRFVVLVWLLVWGAGAALAGPVAPADLAEPPADAATWAIVSQAGQHGQSRIWTGADGARWSRETVALRGMKTDIDQHLVMAADGTVQSLRIRGTDPSGDASESYRVTGQRYRFRSPVDRGQGAKQAGRIYVPLGGTLDSTIMLVDAVRRAPGKVVELLPSGRLSIETLDTAVVSNGTQTRTLTLYAVVGFGYTPAPVWYDGDTFFGMMGYLSYVPVSWEGVVAQLTQVQDAAMARRAPELLAQLAPKLTGSIVFRNVRMFDADAGRFREAMTVVAADGRIVDVGDAATTVVPAGARVIEGQGKTLVPGLWDNHMHYGDDYSGPFLMAQGITSTRDPGNRPEEAMARRQRILDGTLLGPRILPSLLIDGPGERAAQVGVVVHDRAEALAAVERARREGYVGVKLYGSLDPALVQPIVERAHALGLRVHGHVPAGMRTLDAVRSGYDEITHINFVMMQAMPDAVVKQSNGMERFFGPGRYAAAVNLRSPAMLAYLDELQRRGTAVDPTLAVFEQVLTDVRGRVGPTYRPWLGLLPPAVERGTRGGGFAPPAGVKRSVFQRSFRKLRALLIEMHRRGASVLAGTDGSGIELVRELELYVQGGMTPAEALATATIVPARAYGLAGETGSIAVGKKAELVLVDGDPSRFVGDLRRVEMVVHDGRVMNGDALRAAVGIAGMPPRGGARRR